MNGKESLAFTYAIRKSYHNPRNLAKRIVDELGRKRALVIARYLREIALDKENGEQHE